MIEQQEKSKFIEKLIVCLLYEQSFF